MEKCVIAISNDLYKGIKNKNAVYIKEKSKLTYENLSKIKPEYVFFPHWSYIIPKEIYENFNCIIFHMTDLPFGRGGSPLQNLISMGVYNTKISAIKCDKELDSGDIYLKKDFDISNGSAKEIYKRASEIINDMINEIMYSNPKIIPQKQKGNITNFKRRTPAQSNFIEFLKALKNKNVSTKTYDFVRMLDAPGYPKAFIEINGNKFEISNAKFLNGKFTAKISLNLENK